MEEIIKILIKMQKQIDYLYSENCIAGDDWMNNAMTEIKDKLKELKAK